MRSVPAAGITVEQPTQLEVNVESCRHVMSFSELFERVYVGRGTSKSLERNVPWWRVGIRRDDDA